MAIGSGAEQATLLSEVSLKESTGEEAVHRQEILSEAVQAIQHSLIEGCGNAECKNPACYTFKCRRQLKPPRRPTAVAAKAIAFAILSTPCVEQYEECFTSGKLQASIGDNIDRTAFQQRLFAACQEKIDSPQKSQQALTNGARDEHHSLASKPHDADVFDIEIPWSEVPRKANYLGKFFETTISRNFSRPERLLAYFRNSRPLHLCTKSMALCCLDNFNIEEFFDYCTRNGQGEHACKTLGVCLERLEHDGTAGFTDKDMAQILAVCIYALVYVILTAYLDSKDRMCRKNYTRKQWECQEYHDNEFAINLARQVFRTLARSYDGVLVSPDVQKFVMKHFAPNPWTRSRNRSTIASKLATAACGDYRNFRHGALFLLSLWCENIFRLEWHGRSSVLKGSTTHDALQVAGLIHRSYESSQFLYNKRFDTLTPFDDCYQKNEMFEDFYGLRRVRAFKLIDAVDAAKAWLRYQSRDGPVSSNTVPIATEAWLFNADIDIFRALCFCRMLESVETSRLHVALMSYGLGWKRQTNSTDPYRDWPPVPEILTLLDHPSEDWSYGLYDAMAKYLSIKVQREDVLNDAMDQLWHIEKRKVVRPLKVQIDQIGEQGHDVGGVAQEFFSLAMKAAFNLDYGMFNMDDDSRMSWFNPASPEPLHRFELLGVLMALALHNGFTLPLNLPAIFYRKLIGPVPERYNTVAIRDGWPALAHSFDELLDFNERESGRIEDVYVRSYVATIPTFQGHSIDIDMLKYNPRKPWSIDDSIHTTPQDADDAPLVTAATRTEYVSDYIHWLVTKSVAPQFDALARGFYGVIPRVHLQILTSTHLQLLIEGVRRDIDTHELERSTRYIEYARNDPTIRNFWSVVHALPAERKRDLLKFVTASERVPTAGVTAIDFAIQKNGADATRVPSSSTCFGRLLLPEYPDRQSLESKLAIALDNAEGFGNR